MTAQQLWNEYTAVHKPLHQSYQAWAFGCDADLLANLVVCGQKTATASLHLLYQLENEPIPQAGSYHIILDSQNQARCIIQTTKVYITPFDTVTEEHAWKEGEGDRTLQFWQEVHRNYFSKCLQEMGKTFAESMGVVCEEFRVVYQAKENSCDKT